MKKILGSIFIFLLCLHFTNAKHQLLTLFERVPQTSITVTSPTATTNVYPGSVITCTWTCTNEIPFGSRVKVLLVSQAQRTDLLAKMSRSNNIVPVDSIDRVLFIKTSTDAYSTCYWDVPTNLAQGSYAVVVSHATGKLGVGAIFTVNAIAPTPNIIDYSPKEKGSVFGGTISFTGRDIKPEAVQVFIGTTPLEIVSATEGKVVAKISGTQSGALKIGHGLPSNTITLENNFRPIGVPTITSVEPKNVTKGTVVTVTGVNLDSVIMLKNTLKSKITNNFLTSLENSDDFLLLPNEASFLNELTKSRDERRSRFANPNSCSEKFNGGFREVEPYVGPVIFKIEKGSLVNSSDGTKISFTVGEAYQTFDRCSSGNPNARFNFEGNIYGTLSYLPPKENKVDGVLRFGSMDGKQAVVSPPLKLTWRPGQIIEKGTNNTYSPPTTAGPLQIVNIPALTDSTNFITVTPEQTAWLKIVGKGLDSATVKLGGKIISAGLLLNMNRAGKPFYIGEDGNEVLIAQVPYSATSGFLEISNKGVTINIPQKLIIVPVPRVTSISHTTSVPINTDITIQGFDFIAPAEAKGVSINWRFLGVFPSGFSYKAVSSDQNTHVFRIEMAPGTAIARNIPGIGNNVSVFGGGQGSLKFQIQLRQSNQSQSIKYYDFYLTQ